MNYVVDTHCLLWSLTDPSRIERRITQILTDARTTKHVSKISFWEIALKYSIGKLKLEGTTPEEILDASRESGFQILDIGEADIATSHLLPFIQNHRDPFDRLLVWQCMRNDFVLLTADGRLKGYEPYGLRLAAGTSVHRRR